MKRRTLLVATQIIILLLCLGSSRAALCLEPLVLGIHPYLPFGQLEKRFTPLVEYLEKKIGQSIILRVGSSYQEHIETIGRDQIDIGYMGPVSYILMVKKYGYKPLLAVQETNGKPFFKGEIIVRKDNQATTLRDLGKKEFAFVDNHSTMGYIVPLFMLSQANYDFINQKKFRLLKSHENVVLSVLSGDFEAGAIKEAVFNVYKNKGIKAIAVTPPIPEHLLVARSTLQKHTIEQLRKAMFQLNQSPSGKQILHAIKPSLTGLVPVKDEDYNPLRQMLEYLEKEGVIQ